MQLTGPAMEVAYRRLTEEFPTKSIYKSMIRYIAEDIANPKRQKSLLRMHVDLDAGVDRFNLALDTLRFIKVLLDEGVIEKTHSVSSCMDYYAELFIITNNKSR